MDFKRSLFCVAVAATVAGCNNSPAVLTPHGTATATPIATATPVATATPKATATPTPGPTATPTSSSAIVSSVNPIELDADPTTSACGTSFQNVAFSLTETGYTGAFTVTSSNTSLVTITKQDATDFTAVEETTTVPASGTTATITVKDSGGKTLAIPVDFNVICLP